MPPPGIPLDWTCRCRKCGTNGKIVPRSTWYRHNPGGKKAIYSTLADKGEPVHRYPVPRPSDAGRGQKRHHIEIVEGDDEEDGDPLHKSCRRQE